MKKSVIFLPNWSKENPYQDLLATSIEKLDFQVTMLDFPNGAFPINRIVNRTKPTVIHLHWINGLVESILWSRTRLRQRVKLALLTIDILTARLRRVKVVWTIHNVVSHESVDADLEVQARRTIAKRCSHTFVHSLSALRVVERAYGLSLESKSTIVPHGNFDGCYTEKPEDEERFRSRFGLDEEDIIVLFFGAIRPYKGVEKLIEAVRLVNNKSLRTLIAGKPFNQEFGERIEHAAGLDSRIIPILGFIPDEDICGLFAIADVVALPFERTLTSSSATLAFTMSKALLVPENARVFDFVNDQNAIFFNSDEQLRERLETLDKMQLKEMGNIGRKVIEKFDWKSSAEKTVSAYSQFMSWL